MDQKRKRKKHNMLDQKAIKVNSKSLKKVKHLEYNIPFIAFNNDHTQPIAKEKQGTQLVNFDSKKKKHQLRYHTLMHHSSAKQKSIPMVYLNTTCSGNPLKYQNQKISPYGGGKSTVVTKIQTKKQLTTHSSDFNYVKVKMQGFVDNKLRRDQMRFSNNNKHRFDSHGEYGGGHDSQHKNSVGVDISLADPSRPSHFINEVYKSNFAVLDDDTKKFFSRPHSSLCLKPQQVMQNSFVPHWQQFALNVVDDLGKSHHHHQQRKQKNNCRQFSIGLRNQKEQFSDCENSSAADPQHFLKLDVKQLVPQVQHHSQPYGVPPGRLTAKTVSTSNAQTMIIGKAGYVPTSFCEGNVRDVSDRTNALECFIGQLKESVKIQKEAREAETKRLVGKECGTTDQEDGQLFNIDIKRRDDSSLQTLVSQELTAQRSIPQIGSKDSIAFGRTHDNFETKLSQSESQPTSRVTQRQIQSRFENELNHITQLNRIVTINDACIDGSQQTKTIQNNSKISQKITKLTKTKAKYTHEQTQPMKESQSCYKSTDLKKANTQAQKEKEEKIPKINRDNSHLSLHEQLFQQSESDANFKKYSETPIIYSQDQSPKQEQNSNQTSKEQGFVFHDLKTKSPTLVTNSQSEKSPQQMPSPTKDLKDKTTDLKSFDDGDYDTIPQGNQTSDETKDIVEQFETEKQTAVQDIQIAYEDIGTNPYRNQHQSNSPPFCENSLTYPKVQSRRNMNAPISLNSPELAKPLASIKQNISTKQMRSIAKRYLASVLGTANAPCPFIETLQYLPKPKQANLTKLKKGNVRPESHYQKRAGSLFLTAAEGGDEDMDSIKTRKSRHLKHGASTKDHSQSIILTVKSIENKAPSISIDDFSVKVRQFQKKTAKQMRPQSSHKPLSVLKQQKQLQQQESILQTESQHANSTAIHHRHHRLHAPLTQSLTPSLYKGGNSNNHRVTASCSMTRKVDAEQSQQQQIKMMMGVMHGGVAVYGKQIILPTKPVYNQQNYRSQQNSHTSLGLAYNNTTGMALQFGGRRSQVVGYKTLARSVQSSQCGLLDQKTADNNVPGQQLDAIQGAKFANVDLKL